MFWDKQPDIILPMQINPLVAFTKFWIGLNIIFYQEGS